MGLARRLRSPELSGEQAVLDFVTLVVDQRWTRRDGFLPRQTREELQRAVHRTIVESPEIAPKLLSALYALR